MVSQVITANRLDDGLVVFLDSDKKWVENINNAIILDDAEQAKQLLSTLEDGEFALQVVGPYLIDVENKADQTIPLKYRERIRTLGPTVRTDLGYQAGQ